MKINFENAKRQRMIARQMKSGKSLVGLLAGIAVGSATSGCYCYPFIGPAGVPDQVAQRYGWVPQYISLPKGTGIQIGEYTQLQLPQRWAYKSRCKDGRCFLSVSVDGGWKEEFEVTEHINRMLKASGSDGIIGSGKEFQSKPEVSIWPLREDLAIAVDGVDILGKYGKRFTSFELRHWALLRKEVK